MMTARDTPLSDAFAETLAFLSLDHAEAAKLLGVSTRTIRRWLEDEDIPATALAALRAWCQLHERHLAWKPDSIAVFEDDTAQIVRAQEHAKEVAGIIKRVESRGGPKNPWSIDMMKCQATFGPFEVGFYKLANGGFSFSTYRRKDKSPDPVSDRPFLEDAAYCISLAFSKAARSAEALRALTAYVVKHADGSVFDGPAMPSVTERKRRQKEILAAAEKIDELAKTTSGSGADYARFEALLNQLHDLGFFPTIDLVSEVAMAMH